MNSILFHRLKKILVLIMGGTVLLIGIILIFLPGPSFIVIPAGLAILAIEFSWARNLLKKVQNKAGRKFFGWIPWKWQTKDPKDNTSTGVDKRTVKASPTHRGELAKSSSVPEGRAASAAPSAKID